MSHPEQVDHGLVYYEKEEVVVDLIKTSAKPDGVVLEVVCFGSVGLRIFVELGKVSVENALFHFLAL